MLVVKLSHLSLIRSSTKRFCYTNKDIQTFYITTEIFAKKAKTSFQIQTLVSVNWRVS